MKPGLIILWGSILPFVAQAQDDISKELSDFIYDYGILADAMALSDSVFMEYYDDAFEGYESTGASDKDFYFEKSKKQLQLIDRELGDANRAVNRMIQQLYDWDMCTGTISDFKILHKEIEEMQGICDELFTNSWGHNSTYAFVSYNKPIGQEFYTLFDVIADRAQGIQADLEDCLQ